MSVVHGVRALECRGEDGGGEAGGGGSLDDRGLGGLTQRLNGRAAREERIIVVFVNLKFKNQQRGA